MRKLTKEISEQLEAERCSWLNLVRYHKAGT